jgi:hypothetical protein
MNSRRFMCCLNPGIAAYHRVIGNTALCITAIFATRLPQRVIRVEGSRGRPPMHFRYSPKS